MTTRKARTRMTALIVTVATGLATLGAAVLNVAPAGAAVSTAPSGSYTAPSPQNYGGDPITFYVSSDRKQVQDIAENGVSVACTPGSSTSVPFTMAAIPLAANGSFSKSTSQKGVITFGGNASYAATYTYTFSGTVHPKTGNGAAGGAGHVRETLVYTDNTKHTCTSGLLTWNATRDIQRPQTGALPPVGSYTAPSPQHYGGDPITFYVSSDKKQLQDIAENGVSLPCPGSTISAPFTMASVPLAADGSFSKTTTQKGVYAFGGNANYAATYTYTLAGHFHSVDGNGVERAAGTLRETVVYTDSAPHTCTSNTVSWTAIRDVQLTQTTARPPAGNYSAPSPQHYGGDPITFTVPGSRNQLQNISESGVSLACAPGSAISEPFTMVSVPLAANGSFSGTSSSSIVVSGHPATVTYKLAGNFHSVDGNGVARAAGTLRETVVYTDTATHTCTSNTVAWTGTRTS